MKTLAVLSSLVAGTLAAPAQSANQAKDLSRPACTVEVKYLTTWSKPLGSRWRYRLRFTGVELKQEHTANVYSGMGLVTCCQSGDNKAAWIENGGIVFEFGEVVQPVGRTKAMCVSWGTALYVAEKLGCQAKGEVVDVKCA